jgi:hypothetical protein
MPVPGDDLPPPLDAGPLPGDDLPPLDAGPVPTDDLPAYESDIVPSGASTPPGGSCGLGAVAADWTALAQLLGLALGRWVRRRRS